jgi:hypothetical protein
LSRRPGRGRNDPDPSPDDAEAEATIIAIAGLRWRLRRRGALEHPDVLREFRRLEQDVLVQMEQAGENPGRHRSPARRTRGQAGDSPLNLKPDPLRASTAAEFVKVLWQYRAWSGDATWRTIAARAGQARVHSTSWAAMHRDALPKLGVVAAVITGCGGTEDDLRAFTTAWHRVDSGTTGSLPPSGEFQAAPVPALRLITGR